MLAGYITYEELKLITGYSDVLLSKLITKGLAFHELDLEYNNKNKPKRTDRYKRMLFNIKEVEEWLKIHIF
jgi:hypothetical protein